MSTDSIETSEVKNSPYSLIYLLAEGGKAALVFLEAFDERLEVDGGVIYGLLQCDTFLLLEHGQYVVRIMPSGLLLVIGVDVLRVVIKLANDRRNHTLVTHVCNGDQIRRLCLHELKNRVVEYLIREVEPKAAAEHPERSENSAVSTSDQGIGVHVEHDVFLAELGFHSEAVDIMLHVLQEAVVRRFTGGG